MCSVAAGWGRLEVLKWALNEADWPWDEDETCREDMCREALR